VLWIASDIDKLPLPIGRKNNRQLNGLDEKQVKSEAGICIANQVRDSAEQVENQTIMPRPQLSGKL